MKIKAVTTSVALVVASFLFISNGAFAQSERERAIKPKSTPGAQPQPAGGTAQVWAVLIGVSRYKHGDQSIGGNKIPNLKNAADDAQALYDFLRSDERGGFRDAKEGGHMTLLKDEQATRANVERALNGLRQAKPDDYFVIYIAAHGALVPQRDSRTSGTEEVPFFLLHDSDLRDMNNTAIRMDSFRELVTEVPAKNGLVLSDTCHSAGVQLAGRGLYATTRANSRFLDEMKRVGRGVAFLSAADQTELSYELDDLNHGAFTWCLLEGLRGNADIDRDGKITFLELKDYLRDRVPEMTNQRQHPQYNTTTIEANYIPVAVVPYIDRGKTGPADRYGTLVIRTPDLEGVEVAVDGESIGTFGRGSEQRVRVPIGNRNLTFAKAGAKRTLVAGVEAGSSKLVEVNLSFSESDEDALVETSGRQLNVFMPEDKAPTKEAKDQFVKGVDAFNKQKFDQAIEMLNRAIQANGGAYADAFVYRGRAEQSSGRPQAAVVSFKAALAIRPSDFETEALLAEARFNAGDNVQEIVTQLLGITRRHPNYEYARVVLGDVLLWRGDLVGAELELRRAVKINPKSPPARMILADVLMYQDSKEKQKEATDEAEEALKLFEEVSRKQVSAARGLKRLSISHVIFGGGRYTNAAATAEAHHILAKALTRMVEYNEGLANASSYLDRARMHLQEALKLARTLPDKRRLALVLATSAQNYQANGDVAKAIEDADQALKTAEAFPEMKDLPEAHHALYSAYTSNQRFAKAVEHLEKYIAVSKGQLSPDERARLDEELVRLKRLKEANRQKN